MELLERARDSKHYIRMLSEYLSQLPVAGGAMIDVIYVEREAREHPRSQRILERFSKATVIECERYGEVFNRASQNFRLQKQAPALAAKNLIISCYRRPKVMGLAVTTTIISPTC